MHLPPAQRLASKLVVDFKIAHHDKILVVGCGFGWLVESLGGYCSTVIGTEISPWIHEAKHTSERLEIIEALEKAGIPVGSPTWHNVLKVTLRARFRTRATIMNADSLTQKSREAVMEELGDAPDFIITEEVMNMLDADESADLVQALSHYEGHVVHIVKGRVA